MKGLHSHSHHSKDQYSNTLCTSNKSGQSRDFSFGINHINSDRYNPVSALTDGLLIHLPEKLGYWPGQITSVAAEVCGPLFHTTNLRWWCLVLRSMNSDKTTQSAENNPCTALCFWIPPPSVLRWNNFVGHSHRRLRNVDHEAVLWVFQSLTDVKFSVI